MESRYHILFHSWLSLSQGEMARRHRELKAVMHDANCPAAVVFSRDGNMKSWLSGVYTQGFAGAGDILITDGDSYSVGDEFLHFRHLDVKESLDEFVTPGCYDTMKRFTRFSCTPIQEAFRRAGVARLGVYHPDEMNVETARYLENCLPGLRMIDLTERFDRVRMMRSEEELHFSKRAVDEGEKVMAAVPALLDAGRTEYETANRIRSLSSGTISGDLYMKNIVKIVSNPDGKPLDGALPNYPGRYLQKGDRVDITYHCMTENWIYGMVARSFVLADQIADDTRKYWAVAVAANALAAKMLLPGMTLGQVADEVNAYLVGQGSKADDGNFLYSMFNGIQEKPCLFDPSQNEPLRAGMLVGVCPTAAFEGVAPMRCGDVYQITETGAKRMGSLSQELVAVKGI